MKALLAIAFAVMTAISAAAFAQPAVLRAVAPEPFGPLGSFRCSATIEVTIDRRGFVVDTCVLQPGIWQKAYEAATPSQRGGRGTAALCSAR